MPTHKPSIPKRIALTVFNQYVSAQKQLHDLTYLFWECTVRCNINCLHCGSDCRTDTFLKDMPVKDFLKILEKIRNQYNPAKVMVVITGGEPLVRKDLEFAGDQISKLGFPWGMVTNGYLMTPSRFSGLINSGLRSITVSLDGFEESHNWLRGRSDSYQKAVEAIKLIVKQEGLVYDVVTCVNQKNFKELVALRQFLVETGVNRWRLFTIFPSGRAKDNALLDVAEKQFVELMEFIRETRVQGKIKTSFGCEGFLGTFENEARDGYFFCRAGVNIASVLADGSIGACPNINHGFIQGNIYRDDFLEVWNNKYDQYRNRDWCKAGICEKCKVFKWCHGNGMHLRLPEKPDVLRCHYKMIEKGIA